MSALFLLVCFVCLKESTCERRKNYFYFTLKTLPILKIIKFQHFRYSNIMTSSNAQAWNMKHILLNNLGSKQILVMKFGQFMQYYKKDFYQKILWKMWPGKLVKTWEEHGGSLKCCPKIAVKEFIWKKSYQQVSKKIVRWEGCPPPTNKNLKAIETIFLMNTYNDRFRQP